jgi:hypothetical protein
VQIFPWRHGYGWLPFSLGEEMMAVALTRRELDASGLRREATRCRDAKAARRMLALALVLEGTSREAAARHTGPRAA